MTKVIIFKNDNGGVSIIYPTNEALAILGISEIARKDVPAGKPYKIIDASEVPTDRTYRNAWEIDVSHADGYGIGADAWFAEQGVQND